MRDHVRLQAQPRSPARHHRGRRVLRRGAVPARQLSRPDPARHRLGHRHHCGPCAAAQGLEAFAHVPVRG